jgi:hypothetical protein
MNPLGPISANLETARNHLAACPTYRAFLGVSTVPAAVAKTYLAALPPPADGQEYTRDEFNVTLRPFAVISAAASNGYGKRRTATGGGVENGRLFIWLEIAVPTNYQPDPEVAAVDLTADLELGDRWINNQIGQIVSEFFDLGCSATPGCLDVSAIDVRMGPCREDADESATQGNYYATLLEVTWGATE